MFDLPLLKSIMSQVIESVDKIEKRFEKYGGVPFTNEHPEIDWKGAIGARDFLSHHCFDLDAEVVFQICKYRIPDLKKAVTEIMASLQSSFQQGKSGIPPV